MHSGGLGSIPSGCTAKNFAIISTPRDKYKYYRHGVLYPRRWGLRVDLVQASRGSEPGVRPRQPNYAVPLAEETCEEITLDMPVVQIVRVQ